jgi:hypothetical protein
MTLTQSPTAHGAGFDANIGGGNCMDVKRQITRDWMQLKSFFRADSQNMKRPKSKDFFCVSPSYVRNAVKNNSVSHVLNCYTLQGQGFCCDSALNECAGL